MAGFGDHKKSQKGKKNLKNNFFKEQIIHNAFKFHAEGNIPEAIKYYKAFINTGFEDNTVFSNFGMLLIGLGKLKEAELFTRKALELNPNNAIAHSNLGGILRDLGKLKEAELSTRKSLELNPNLGIAYYIISTLKYPNKNQKWKETLFSENFLDNKSKKDQVNIYFARANILHNEKKYQESSRYLQLANELKLDFKKSQSDYLINKSKLLLFETDKEGINQTKITKYPESIFIVGMPRSGSTLVESILSMNSKVFDLGEVNILEESFLQQKNIDEKLTLTDIYWNKISKYTENFYITTNKWLFNYQYAGIISREIKNAKIIHCFRNPLDNILSIYRANFTRDNEFSSSLRDCTKIYLDQEEIMSNYKNRFRSKIYDLNYDSLVSNSDKEIKSLISWLDWKWEDSYLSPHLNKRSVLTSSSVQIRSPINSKSIGGWKNYKDMLQPAIEILTQTEKYQNLHL